MTGTGAWEDLDGTVHDGASTRNGSGEPPPGEGPTGPDATSRLGVVTAAPVTDFARLVQPAEEERPRHLRDQLLTVTQLAQLPPVRPLIDGLLYCGTLAQLSGAPGSYKSFLAVAWAVCTALSEPFEDHPVPHGGPVIYAAPEGATGLRARILAYCETRRLDPVELNGKLFILPAAVPLDKHVTEAMEVVTEVDAALLVLDTRARCTGDLDENSATAQGIAINRAEQLAGTDCTTLVVHHASRTGTAGRGSNSWDGAVWSDLRITGSNLSATLTCEKHKDVPAGCEHPFRLVPHTVSEGLMPGCTDRERSTLVIVRSQGRDDLAVDGLSDGFVRRIVRECAGPEGLTRPQIVSIALERGHSRSQSYAAINTEVKRGALVNVSPSNRPYFALSHTHTGIRP